MPICAAIDLGSNALRLKVASWTRDHENQTLCAERIEVRLGVGAFSETAEIDEPTVLALIEAMRHFRALMDGHGVEMFRAVATSAMREASNRDDIIARVLEATGIAIEVISGSEEARLIQLGAQLENPPTDQPVFYIDIGGGSMEVSVGTAGVLQALHSYRLGAVRLTEMFVRSDPISEGETRRLRAYVGDELAQHADIFRAYSGRATLAIGTGGTIGALVEAGLAQSKKPDSGASIELTRAELDRLIRELRERDSLSRQRLPGINASRADIILAGALALREVMKMLGIDRIRPSSRNLRDGMLMDLIERTSDEADLADRLTARRRGFARVMAERFNVRQPHADHVARMALELFKALLAEHKLGHEERDMLEAAALLHECGMAISFSGFHKHSQYIIDNAELLGFTREEIRMISLIARYHRKAEPSNGHYGYGPLNDAQKEVVMWLSGILRVADALDRQQGQHVRALRFLPGEEKCAIEVDASGEVSLELWSAARKGGLLERMLKRKIVFSRA